MYVRIGDRPVPLWVRPENGAAQSATAPPGAVLLQTKRRSLRDGEWRHLRLEDGTGGWAPPEADLVEMPTATIGSGEVPTYAEPDFDRPTGRSLKAGAWFHVIGAPGYDDWVEILLPSSGRRLWLPGDAPIQVAREDKGVPGGRPMAWRWSMAPIGLTIFGAIWFFVRWEQGWFSPLGLGLMSAGGISTVMILATRKRATATARHAGRAARRR